MLWTVWFFLFQISCSRSTGSSSSVGTAPSRPAHVLQALETNGRIYYFGVGSNVLREKLVNRGLNGTKISFSSFQPGKVKDWRLAFNMRGFLPSEPAMGGIEPCVGSECHGALVEMPAAEYQKVWMSEGGGAPRPGYEECVVEAVPYGQAKPVLAVALRAAPHARLATDAAPSARYMDIILRGARELGLEATYIDALQAVPTAQVPPLLRLLAAKNFLFVGLLFKMKLRFLIFGLSRLLWMVYYPGPQGQRGAFMRKGDAVEVALSGGSGRVASVAVAVRLRLLLSQLAMACVLLPTAFLGLLIELALRVTGKPIPTSPFGGAAARPANASTAAAAPRPPSS